MFISNTVYQGDLFYFMKFSCISDFIYDFYANILENMPGLFTIITYGLFLLSQGLLMWLIPWGPRVQGLKLADGQTLEYRCNAYICWCLNILSGIILHTTGIFDITTVVSNLGPYLSTAMIFGDLIAIVIYLGARISKNATQESDSVIYDFFMGTWLNPRIGYFDLKMFAEIRISWTLLFLLTVSAAITQYRDMGTLTLEMGMMCLAHFLYANACMKGEECIPTTWDIFHEKFGWMLIFWIHR